MKTRQIEYKGLAIELGAVLVLALLTTIGTVAADMTARSEAHRQAMTDPRALEAVTLRRHLMDRVTESVQRLPMDLALK